jgi:rod shape-determining protein MreD
MVKKIIIFTLFVYFLILLQTSFLVHFSGCLPNLVLIAVILVNIFEDRKDSFGIIFSFIAGFFLDIFFGKFIGYYVMICFFISLFIKLIFKNYIQPNLKLN